MELAVRGWIFFRQVKDEVTDALKRAEQAGIVRGAGGHDALGEARETKEQRQDRLLSCSSM